MIVTDSRGRRALLDVSSAPGSTTPPAILVVPNPISGLTCTSNSQSAGIIGGFGPLSAISSHPRLTAIISGNIITVTRAPNGDGATVFPVTATITITDGNSLYTLNVTGIAANCP